MDPYHHAPSRLGSDSSWLIRDGMDRERMVDMDARIRPARMRAFAVLALALIACGPWLGFWTLIPLAGAALLFGMAERMTVGMRRPEYVMFAVWAVSELIIAVSVSVTGGSHVAMMSWLAIPVVTLVSRFSNRGVVVGVLWALVLLLAISVGIEGHAVSRDPTTVIAPAALIIAVTLLSMALMHSDIEYRSRAVIDELTGMLNRSALASRVSELTQQSRLTSESVGLIIADIDHFKAVNDEYGHTRGDAVLFELAFAMRRELRAYDLAYRIGGEEFLVLLPGADLTQAEVIAEQLRSVVESEAVAGGIEVTISCGVSASQAGWPFHYPTLFSAADAALYRAKWSGRNRVCTSSSAAESLTAVAG
jgi:diguanylate cyclase (GGDEF)-like protein